MTQRYYSSIAQPMALTSGVISTGLILVVNATAGLPTQVPFTLVLDPGTATEEVVTVTDVAGFSLTVLRGEDGSAAQAHATGAVVRHMMTARDLREPQQHIDASTAIHGLDTATIVGTTTTQTLSGKSMNGIDNSFTAIPKLSITGYLTDQTDAAAALAAEATSRTAADTALDTRAVALEADIFVGAAAPAHSPGRMWINDGTGLVQLSSGGAWRYLSGPLTRSWSSPARAGVSDNFSGNGAFTQFGSIVITGARAGKYLLVYHAGISTSAPGSQVAYSMLYANAVQIMALQNNVYSTAAITPSFTMDYTHAATGNLTLLYGFQGSAGILTVQNNVTSLRVYYLGE